MKSDLVSRAISEPMWPDQRTQIPQVRIATTYRCARACFYCRPSGESVPIKELDRAAQGTGAEMSVQETVDVVSVLARQGVSDLKLTGGDPLLRPDIVELVAALKAIPGIRSVHLVTRHPRAAEVAADLKSAGLDLLNFSLDSLNGKTWKKITRTSGHGTLIEAVRKCAKLGLPMKLNMVVLRDVNDHEIAEMVRFAGDIGADLKLLDLIGDITDESQKTSGLQKYYTSLDAQGEWLATVATDCSVVTAPGGLGHPMPQYSMPSGVKVMIKSAHFGAYYGATCSECQHYPCWDALMALRVTANGMLQYCLVRDDNLVDLLGMLRRGDAAEAERAVASVLAVYRNASPIAGKDLQRLRAEKATRSVAS